MLARYVLPLDILLDACCQPDDRSYSQPYFSLEPVCEPCVERVCLRPTRATITSYCVRSLFVVTPFHAFHSSAFSLILSACLQESNTHGVGLFAVKDMKTGHFTDIDCFGTFVLYYTKTEVHDAIAADGVPRYMVASMCVGGEVLCRMPHYF